MWQRKKEFLPGQTRLIDADNVMVAVFNLDGEILRH